MTATFRYALPDQTTLQQEAAIARGLRCLFPDIDFEQKEGDFLTGDIVPVAAASSHSDADEAGEMPRLLVMEVKTAFAGLLIDALAEPAV